MKSHNLIRFNRKSSINFHQIQKQSEIVFNKNIKKFMENQIEKYQLSKHTNKIKHYAL